MDATSFEGRMRYRIEVGEVEGHTGRVPRDVHNQCYEPQPRQPQYPSQDPILLLSSLKFKYLDCFNIFPEDGCGGLEYDNPLLSEANNSYASVGSLVDMTETIILTELRTAR